MMSADTVPPFFCFIGGLLRGDAGPARSKVKYMYEWNDSTYRYLKKWFLYVDKNVYEFVSLSKTAIYQIFLHVPFGFLWFMKFLVDVNTFFTLILIERFQTLTDLYENTLNYRINKNIYSSKFKFNIYDFVVYLYT